MAALTVIVPTPGVAVFANSPEWHDLQDIRQTAARFVEARSQRPRQEAVVSAGELDARLKLHRCDRPLEPYLPPGGKVSANTTVGVRCDGPKRWKLFVPVRVGLSAHVLVASRPLARGAKLKADDLVAIRRDLSHLHSGYVTANEPVVGMVLKRRMSEGQVLRPDLLTTARLIRRGQSLTIVSGGQKGTFAIRMAGTALSDGRLGERIRVKNRSSGRTVEGIVRSAERVEIAR